MKDNPTTKDVAQADGVLSREVPTDLSDYAGKYALLNGGFPGEVFGLKILNLKDVRHGKTHHAKSPLRFGDYTPEEFRAQFEKL